MPWPGSSTMASRNETTDFRYGFEQRRCVVVQPAFSRTKNGSRICPRVKQSRKLNLILCGILFHKRATFVNIRRGDSPAHAIETGTGKPNCFQRARRHSVSTASGRLVSEAVMKTGYTPLRRATKASWRAQVRVNSDPVVCDPPRRLRTGRHWRSYSRQEPV